MKRYAVLLLDHRGYPWSDRGSLKVVDAESESDAVRKAHDFPPHHQVSHAWVHELVADAHPHYVEVDVPHPEWGSIREAAL